jgi:EF-P beta-lysylation protein EpmB
MAIIDIQVSSRSHTTPTDWTSILAESIRDPAELCRLLGLDAAWAAKAIVASADFPLLVPRPYLARIRHNDPADPLLRQVLPQTAELASVPGFEPDPLREREAQCAPGLLRKYQGRLLMVTTDSCAVHCRFCFRRHFSLGVDGKICPGSHTTHAGGSRGKPWPIALLATALSKIAADRTVREVILSGGDPLMLDDDQLAEWIDKLGQIVHLARLRVHSRLPIMIPQRVTDDLIVSLARGGKPIFMVVHVNHPAEIDRAVADALGRLVDGGIPVLSQSVLLRGVNDRVDTLAELFERLINLRVLPYYLHHLDPVAGAAHFSVPVEAGRKLVEELRTRLPGYAVPRYALETPGGKNKEILA